MKKSVQEQFTKSEILMTNTEYHTHTFHVDEYDISPLDEMDAAVEADLDEVRQFIHQYDIQDVFVCGGFAAYVLDVTDSYGDIDLYCVNPSSFDKIQNLVRKTVSLEEVSRSGNYRIVFKLKSGIQIDFINASKEWTQQGTRSDYIKSILSTFDISWCMVGLDLIENQIVYHCSALADYPLINQSYERRPAGYQPKVTLHDRLVKYVGRIPDLDWSIVDKLTKKIL